MSRLHRLTSIGFIILGVAALLYPLGLRAQVPSKPSIALAWDQAGLTGFGDRTFVEMKVDAGAFVQKALLGPSKGWTYDVQSSDVGHKLTFRVRNGQTGTGPAGIAAYSAYSNEYAETIEAKPATPPVVALPAPTNLHLQP
jgi:hypothetical protein